MLQKLNIHFFTKTDTPLKLPELQTANKTIERTFSIKFLKVMLDKKYYTERSYTYNRKENSRKSWFTLSRKTVTK